MTVPRITIKPGVTINSGVTLNGYAGGNANNGIPQYGAVPTYYAIGGGLNNEEPLYTASVTYSAPVNSTTFVFISTDTSTNDQNYISSFSNQVDSVQNDGAINWEYIWVSSNQNTGAVVNSTVSGTTNSIYGYWIAIADSLVSYNNSQPYLAVPATTISNDNGAPLHSSTETGAGFGGYTFPAGTVAVIFSGVEVDGAQITSITSTGVTWQRRSSKSNYGSNSQTGGFQTAEIWYAINDTGFDLTSDVIITYASPYDDQAAILSAWYGTNMLAPWPNSVRQQPNPATNVGGMNLSKLGSTTGAAAWYPMVTTQYSSTPGQFTINTSSTYSVPSGFTFVGNWNWATFAEGFAVVSNAGKTITALSGENPAYGDLAIGPSDKIMFSVTIDVWSQLTYSDAVGVGDATFTTGYGGADPTNYALYDDGSVIYNNNEVLYGQRAWPSFQHDGDIIDVAVDRVHNTMWVRVNGGAWNVNEFTITSSDQFVSRNAVGNIGGNGISSVTVDAADSYLSSWRLFILDADYPDIGNQVIVGTSVTVDWGSSVTATVTDIIHDTGYGRWVFIVDQNVASGFPGGPKTVSFAPNGGAHWTSSTEFTIIPAATTYNNSPVNTTVGSFVYLDDAVDSNTRQRITQAFEGAGMLARVAGGYEGGATYLWNVTWADNTTDVVRLQWAQDFGDNGRLWLSVVDTSAPGWNTPRPNSIYPTYPTMAVKMGTYTFPARFSPILPVIINGRNYDWC